jgi:hypothetical protein
MSSVIKDALKKKRDTLSESSIKTYGSILTTLHKKLFGDDIDVANFKKETEIVKYLEDLAPNKVKTTLSALVVLTDNKKYREIMLDKISKYNQEINKQEKTEKQESNWITQQDIDDKMRVLKKNAKAYYNKEPMTIDDLQNIQQYIILCLYTMIPPRRSLDFVKAKINSIDKKKDNYISGNQFVFNQYKTAKFYGEQKLAIPKELKTILNKWIKVNPTDNLLFDNRLNPLTAITLNQRINKIFEKNVGVNGFRHTYLTTKYASVEKQNQAIAEDMTDMGSSITQKKTYIKTDD